MNMEISTSLAIALFVYVIVSVILGVINWSFHVFPNDAVLVFAAVLGVATFAISAWKTK